MNTQSLNKVFEDFLYDESVDYALLINGNWGTGKTHYWKTTFVDTIKQANLIPLYISINGIGKIEDIQDLLLSQLIPYLKDENKVKLAKLLKWFVELVSKAALRTSVGSILTLLSGEIINYRKCVVCVDDLERCKMDIGEVLGFLNYLVEHKKLKTVILSDEKKIGEGKYKNIKEKLIGRTVNFEPEIEKCIKAILDENVKNEKCSSYLKENLTTLTNLIIKLKINNLRTIKFFFKSIEKIFPNFSQLEFEIKSEILILTLLISNEYKEGKLSSSDVNNFQGLDAIDSRWYHNLRIERIKNLKNDTEYKEKGYKEIFHEKYLLTGAITNFHFYKSIYNYILSGFLDDDFFKIEIEDCKPKAESEEVVAYQKLLNPEFNFLDDEEFEKLVQDVIKYAKNGSYSIYDYYSIADYFYWFRSLDLIDLDENALEKIIEKGIMISKVKTIFSEFSFARIKAIEKSVPPPIDKTIKLITDAHEELKNQHLIDIGHKFIEAIKLDTSFDDLDSSSIYSSGFIKSLNAQELYEAIIHSNGKQLLKVVHFFNQRYSPINVEYLQSDLDILIILKGKIEDYIKNDNPRKLNRYNLNILVKSLDIANNKLQSRV